MPLGVHDPKHNLDNFHSIQYNGANTHRKFYTTKWHSNHDPRSIPSSRF